MEKSSIGIIVLFLLLFILPLGARPIVIPDESRYAEIPREMIVSGDWIVPHLNGLRYFEKPILGYWANAASIMLFGENRFAIRLPSAISTGISALMVFFLSRRFAGGYWAGILAAGAFLTCMGVYGIGTFSVLDSVFSMFVTVAMASFFFAHMEEGKSARRTGFLFLFGASCGLAFLTKGFIAFVIPAVTIAPFMIWEARWRELFSIPWLPFAAALLIALPWCVMIHLREPDFWHYFFWEEHIRRFFSGHPQHPSPFWFFIPNMIVATQPWTALLPAAIQGLGYGRTGHPIVRFAVCWFLFPFLFFSASHGKLLTYILPCYSPLVILIAVGLLKYFEAGKKRAFIIGVRVLALFTGILAVALVLSQVSGFPETMAYYPSETCKWSVGAVALLIWTSLLLRARKSTDVIRKLVLFSMGPLLFMFSAHFIIPDQIKNRKAPGGFLRSHANRIGPDSILVTTKLASAVCWFYKRNDIYLLVNSGELDYGLSYDDAGQRLLSVNRFKRLVAASHGLKKVTLIAKARPYARYRSLLPKPAFEDIDGGFVFTQF